MHISIGADHAGFDYKSLLISHFSATNIALNDFGTHGTASVDYPDYVHPLCIAVAKGEYSKGILICGSANGVAITANKYSNIRAAIAWLPEIASLARQHNDANIICIPARFVSLDAAIEIIQNFIDTPFEGGRHQTRVDKIWPQSSL